MNIDNGCTVKQAAESGWDKEQRILAYKGRTIYRIRATERYEGMYLVSYDCGQADLLYGNDRLDVFIPLAVHKAELEKAEKETNDAYKRINEYRRVLLGEA